jgi:hypothetical protein
MIYSESAPRIVAISISKGSNIVVYSQIFSILFILYEAIPLDKFTQNSNIAMVLTKHGGHLRFAQGYFPLGCQYSCCLFKDYLKSVLDDHAN